MKKTLLFFVLAQLLLLACSSDNQTTTTDTAENLTAENYKGVFTTLDGSSRGVLDVSISEDGTFATGTLTLSTDEEITLFSSDVIDNGDNKSISFTGEDVEFVLTTTEEGETVVIDNVLYRGLESSLLVSQHTNRAPVTPITGTYECTMCGGSVDNVTTQTFNLMFTTADGAGSISSQTTLGSNVFNGIGVQTACNANGLETTCTVTSGDGVSNTGFIAGDGPVTWVGTHTFNNEATGPNDCSGVFGTWNWASTSQGIVTGTFISDNSCNSGVPVELYSEDFQTFTGAGFTPMPAAGQLDSDIIIANGFAGSLDYGGTQDTGDFARGQSTGDVSEPGIYAFDVDSNGNIGLGVQPGGSDFTPGEFDIRVENTTGTPLSSFTISYDLFVNNNETRANSLNFSYSTDNMTFIPISSLDFTSTEAADTMGFVNTSQMATFNVTVTDGSFIYLRFEGSDVSGSSSRDEFAIDNISLEGN